MANRSREAATRPFTPTLVLVALVGAFALTPRGAAAQTVAPTVLVAGVLPAAELEADWPRSGAWLFPVGDSLDFTRATDAPGYRVNRGVLGSSKHTPEHQGADLANGSAGGRVRAAAHGIVAFVQAKPQGGYGVHVVIAHHLADGQLVYTVYAHLTKGSVVVRQGAPVYAGELIARVGRTGRTTCPHLHFEVRVPSDSTAQWLACPVVDPVAFVHDRLPAARDPASWSTTYLMWAELGGMLPAGLAADSPVDAAMLRRVVACTVVDTDPDSVIHEAGLDAAGPDVSWEQVSSTLGELDRRAHRLAPCPMSAARHEQACIERLGIERPARELDALSRRSAIPLVADLCLTLADLAAAAPDLSSR